MARSYRINVKYDPTKGSLKIDRPDLTLAPDTSAIHSVCWVFEGVSGIVAAGWAPAIRFSRAPDGSGAEYLGPFTNLNMTTSAVIASGLNGKRGTYHYHAALRAPIGSGLPTIRSKKARLYNRVKIERLPVVRVSPYPNKEILLCPDKERILRVQPEELNYYPGQSILWEVDEELNIGKWFPRLRDCHKINE